MAFALVGHVGFETGGGEVLSAVTGTVTFPAAAARSGGYGARIGADAGNDIQIAIPSFTAAGNVYSFQYKVPDDTPASKANIVDCRPAAGAAWELFLNTDGTLQLEDDSATQTNSTGYAPNGRIFRAD